MIRRIGSNMLYGMGIGSCIFLFCLLASGREQIGVREITAVLAYSAVCGGMAWINGIRRLCLPVRTGIHMAVCLAALLAANLYLNPGTGILPLFWKITPIFAVIYLLLWVVCFLLWRRDVRKINERLKGRWGAGTER